VTSLRGGWDELPRWADGAGTRQLAVARYGWGRGLSPADRWPLRRLGRWLERVSAAGVRLRVASIAAPMLDKAWAEQAGLGLDRQERQRDPRRRGSWFLIGHLAHQPGVYRADAPAKPSAAAAALHRCLPHGSIAETSSCVDARRCQYAFHTHGTRWRCRRRIRRRDGPWVGGCDICQGRLPLGNHQPLISRSDFPILQPKPWIARSEEREPFGLERFSTGQSTLRGSGPCAASSPWMWAPAICWLAAAVSGP